MPIAAAAAHTLAWTSAWLLTYLLHGTLLLAAAWGAGRLLRSPVVREVLWKAAAVGSLLTASVALAVADRPTRPAAAAYGGPSAGGRPALPAPRVPAAAVVGLWLGTAVLGLSRLERGRRRYWRGVDRRRTLADPAAARTLRRLQAAAGYARVVHLTTSEGLGAPVAIGTAEICLPADSLAALSPAQRESVLAHELGHLVRRDPLWRFAVDVLAALFVVQPLLRVARRELRECAEMCCDDFAVQLTGRRRPLVESLAILAGSVRPDHAPAVGFGEGDSPLVRRAARVLDARWVPVRPLRRMTVAALAAAMLAATAASAPAVAPPAAVPRPMLPERLKFVSVELESAGAGAAVPSVPTGTRRRELTLQRGPQGLAVEQYAENGVPVAPDSDARRWIADVLRRHDLR